jgi:transcriptional regulator with XRE-family HTH domain
VYYTPKTDPEIEMSKKEQTNRIREVRTKAGMSQSALAAASGTSQQQVARIERGVQKPKLDLARRISEALHLPMERVFPQSAAAMKRMRAMGKSAVADDMLNGGSLSDELDGAGIELDPREWLLKVRLTNGTEHMLPISAKEYRYARSAVQSEDEQFLIVDTADARVLINLEHLEFAHFLFEATPRNLVIQSTNEADDKDDPLDPRHRVIAYTAGSPNPLSFGAEAEGEPSEDDDDMGEFGHLFAMAGMMQRGDAQYRFHFTDVDGEEVLLLARSLVMLSVPLWVVDSSALEAVGDLDEQEASA